MTDQEAAIKMAEMINVKLYTNKVELDVYWREDTEEHWCPQEDIEQAFEVLDVINKNGDPWQVGVWGDTDEHYCIIWTDSDEHCGFNKKLEEAIFQAVKLYLES